MSEQELVKEVLNVTLYKKGKNKILKYNIQVIAKPVSIELFSVDYSYTIYRFTGSLGCKKKRDILPVLKGKQSRSIKEQAILNAESFINKKVNGGYKSLESLNIVEDVNTYLFKGRYYITLVEVLNKAFEGNFDTDSEGRVLPMQPKKLRLSSMDKDAAKGTFSIDYPCMVQAKVDGIAGLFDSNKGFYSRGGKSGTVGGTPWNMLFYHMVEELVEFQFHLPYIIHGELFKEGNNLDTIATATKAKNLLTKELEFWIFDIIATDSMSKRFAAIEKEISRGDYKYLKVVPCKIADSETDLERYEKEFLSKGYEGLVAKNPNTLYISGYTTNVLKLVRFDSTEVEIKGITVDSRGRGLMTCEYCGKLFSVTPAMSHEQREDMVVNSSSYVGKLLTIKYRGLSSYGVPRIASGVSIRDYE